MNQRITSTVPRRRRRAAACTAIWILFACAGRETDAGASAAEASSSTSTDSVVRALYVGESRFPLDSSLTVAEASSKLGIVSPFHATGSHGQVGVCVIGDAASGNTVIELLSDELGGSQHRLLG